VHGETTVMSNNGQSLIWLCPAPSCGSHFTSKPDLLSHVWKCKQVDTLTGCYWCNTHDSFENEVFYRTCDSSRHQDSLNDQISTDFKVLIYKFTRTWSDLEEFQLDPQFCQHCKDSKDLSLFTPDEVVDHVLGHHKHKVRTPCITALQCLDGDARSNVRKVGRSEPMMEKILDLAEARCTEHLITLFINFLKGQEFKGDGIYCGCTDINIPLWESLYTIMWGYPSPRCYKWDDVANMLEHFCTHHGDYRLRNITINQRLHALASPHIQNSIRYLKHREELLRIVKQLQEEVNGTRASCKYLLTAAGPINDVRFHLMTDIDTLLASLKTRLSLNPTSPLPGDLNEDLLHAEKLLDEFLASPDFMDTSGTSEEMKLPAHLDEEKRKLRAMLGRMSSLDKSDQVLPQDKQWANLRTLRFSSSMFHSQILSLTGREGRQKFGFRQRVVIRRLRKQIKSSSDFLITGILTFRRVLQGSVPSTLEEVLAFVSLSHVMSEELWFKGKMADPLNFNAGFPSWMRAIQSKAEQAAFQELAACLWPGSALAFETGGKPAESALPAVVRSETAQSDIPIPSNEATKVPATDIFNMSDVLDEENFPEIFEFPHLSTALEIPYLGAVASGLPAWNDVPPDMLHHSSPLSSYMDTTMDILPYFENTVQQLLGQSHASDDFKFSDFLDIRHWENSPGQPLDPIPSASEARIVEIEAEVASSDPDTIQSTATSETLCNSSQPKKLVEDESMGMVELVGDQASESGVLAILCATAIFQIVLGYMNCKF
jgi:hypothetical protein